MLTATDVHKSYMLGKVPLHVLRGASLEVGRGEFVAIMGISGSGKSTLLHVLGTVDVPDRGNVRMNGADLFAMSPKRRGLFRCREIGFVFQFYHLLPELNVVENVSFPRMVGASVIDWYSGERRRATASAMATLERVGLSDRAKQRPNELSGGERQRVAIARALVNEPQLLFADEPTGNLDAETGTGVLELLAGLHRQGQTIVMVTHDETTASYADRIVHLEKGRIQP